MKNLFDDLKEILSKENLIKIQNDPYVKELQEAIDRNKNNNDIQVGLFMALGMYAELLSKTKDN